MLTAQLSGDAPMTEAEAKEHFENAMASGDPAKYAAQAGAAAACGAVAGPWTAGLCALGAGHLWDKLFGPDCGEQGGTEWCLSKCVETDWVNIAGRYSAACVKVAPIQPFPVGQMEKGKCSSYLNKQVGCCWKTYCQLPHMPAPRPPLETLTPEERLTQLLEKRGRTMAVEPRRVAGLYAEGSVTAQNPQTSMWEVASPRGLSGEAAYELVDERATKPAGVPVVSYTDLLRRTGRLPWYKDWRVWAVTGTVAAAGAGGLLLWKRRKRRKRR